MDQYNLDFQREIESQERIIIGVNQFVPADEPAPPRFKFDRTNTDRHIRRFSELKQQRDKTAWANSLQRLYRIARDGNNPVEAMIDAFVADASIGEVWGTVRVAHDLHFDPYGEVSQPVTYK